MKLPQWLRCLFGFHPRAELHLREGVTCDVVCPACGSWRDPQRHRFDIPDAVRAALHAGSRRGDALLQVSRLDGGYVVRIRVPPPESPPEPV